MDLVERRTEAEIPVGTVREGLLQMVAAILQLPRVRSVRIGLGKIEYVRLVHSNEPVEELSVPLADYRLSEMIRHVDLIAREASDPESPLRSLSDLYTIGVRRGFVPNCILIHPKTALWAWFERYKVEVAGEREYLLGSPVQLDAGVSEDDLFLLFTYGAGQQPQEAAFVVKMHIPEV